jgi:hypothetical protein
MTSKLAIHITMATQAEQMRDFCEVAQPVVVKHVNPDAYLAAWIADHCPETLQVGRKYWEGNQPWGDPERIAREIMDMSAAGTIKVWEGVNEPPRDRLSEVCRTDAEAARILHDNGFGYVCGSWSVGVPDIGDWLHPDMLAALRETDYIGVHAYNAPTVNDPRGIEWFLLRHRLWYPTLPSDCQKPLLITETGIDSGATHWDPGGQGGWQSFTDAEGYVEQLAWLDDELQYDSYVKGATIFQWGSVDPKWETYDHTDEFTRLLRDYIVSCQDGPPPPDIEELTKRVDELTVRVDNLTINVDTLYEAANNIHTILGGIA